MTENETQTGTEAEPEPPDREALVALYRRTARTAALSGSVWLPLSLWWRVRQARRSGDPWAWAAIALTVANPAVGMTVNYSRAGQRADDDLARRARLRDYQRRLRTGEPVQGLSTLPPGRTPTGCLLQGGVMVAGWVQAGWDYLHRPDQGRRVVGRAWSWRPGPAWWTAWSFQQLPVNAASTAPRAAQIAYQRRQLLTLRSTVVAGVAVDGWENQLRRGTLARDPLRVAAVATKLATEITRGIADYRLVPDTVDHQRARRRHHDRTVATLIAARAVGRPGPANPWTADMLATVGAVAAMAGLATNGLAAARAQHRLTRQHPTSASS